MPDEMPDVHIDVMQIDQLLTNLIENAARFAPAGSRIGIDVEHRDSRLRVCVRDEGPGIAVDEREHVFEPFVRGNGSPGSGLGLAISKAIVEAHDGRIWIDGGRPYGTRVTFELPIA